MKKNQDHFEVLRKINSNPEATQRKLASELNFSLGKLNYCLRELKNKGLVKIKSFQKQKDKISHLRYLLTPKGVAFRTRLTMNFMKKKMQEYDQLKKELEEHFEEHKK